MLQFLKGFLKFFKWLFQKEILAAFIGAGVIIGGYMWNASIQRENEKYIKKLQVYENVLNIIESTMPPKDQDDLKKINSAIVLFSLYAPDNVLKRFSDEVIINKDNYFNRDDFRKLQFILHEDIHGESLLINEGYFMTLFDVSTTESN